MKINKTYRSESEKLMNRTIFSYPFMSKSDEELILDAINRANSDLEFSLFKLGERDVKTVPVSGAVVDTKFFPLFSLQNENNPKKIEIKISSFTFPSHFISDLKDKAFPIKSTFNYQSYDSYSKLYKATEKYYGEKVLVTTCWHTVTNFLNIINCVNISPTPKNDSEIADLIRQSFIKERINFINDFLNNPKKYIPFYPIDEDILNECLNEFKHIFENELVMAQNCYNETNSSYYDDFYTSDDELARDTFYALTDGLEGDYPGDNYSNEDTDADDYCSLMGY